MAANCTYEPCFGVTDYALSATNGGSYKLCCLRAKAILSRCDANSKVKSVVVVVAAVSVVETKLY
jgi:hypothetical protein